MSIILKLIYFQCLWFLILFKESSWLYLVCCASLLADWYYFSYHIKIFKYLIFSSFLIISGFCIDMFFNYLGLISWDKNQFYPVALNQLWMIFSVYFGDAFKKFESFLVLGFILTFFGAPLAYLSGSKISSITFNIDQKINLFLFATVWASNFIVFIKFHRKFTSLSKG